MDFVKLEKNIEKTVRKAAKIFNKGAELITEKDGASNIVTDVDVKIERFLRKEFRKLLPDSDFLGEEEGNTLTGSDYLWIIDPIDGTANYARKIEECVISVALLYKNELKTSVVFVPKQKLMFTAIEGKGAFCNGKLIKTSDNDFSHSLFCTSLSPYVKKYAKSCADILLEAYPLCNDFRRFGACALELCYLALGRCDLYFEIRVCPWDCAAALLILKEAGGIATTFNGEPITFDKPLMVIAANNRENFEQLNKIINNNIKEQIIF